MVKTMNGTSNKNEQKWFAYSATTNTVREATGKGTEWDAKKVVIRAVHGAKWFEVIPKGRANRVAAFDEIQALTPNKPLVGQFSSLKVASQKKNLGAHVTGEETVTTSKKTKATKVDATPTIEELMAMIVALQAKQD